MENKKRAIVSLLELARVSRNIDDYKELVEQLLAADKAQIIDAFEEGVKYGNGMQTFDYPASRYYAHTYQDQKLYE